MAAQVAMEMSEYLIYSKKYKHSQKEVFIGGIPGRCYVHLLLVSYKEVNKACSECVVLHV